jgi:hypothetical protein
MIRLGKGMRIYCEKLSEVLIMVPNWKHVSKAMNVSYSLETINIVRRMEEKQQDDPTW